MAESPGHRPFQILAVDQAYSAGEMLQKLFAGEDCEVQLAGNCRQAHLCIELRVPHLILLDAELPDASGIEFCRSLRRNGVTTPVILLTDTPDFRPDCGADDYLSKPFTPEELRASVFGQLGRIERTTGHVPEFSRLWE